MALPKILSTKYPNNKAFLVASWSKSPYSWGQYKSYWNDIAIQGLEWCSLPGWTACPCAVGQQICWSYPVQMSPQNMMQSLLFALGQKSPSITRWKIDLCQSRPLESVWETNRNPQHCLLDVTVHTDSFSRLSVQGDERQPQPLAFHWAAEQSEHQSNSTVHTSSTQSTFAGVNPPGSQEISVFTASI